MFRKLAKKALKRAADKVLGRGGPAPSGPTGDLPGSPSSDDRKHEAKPTAAPAGPDDGIRFADLDEIYETLFGPGKPRLVNHWATWCEGCLEELHLLVDLQAELGSDVEFVGISWEGFQGGMLGQDLIEEVRSYSRLNGLSWGSLLVEAPPPELFDRLNMDCDTVPQVWLIDASGAVVHRIERVLEPSDVQELQALAKELLDAS